ncbi:MAG: MraY family glycosyltransferase [Longimicrobiales bacterium]
MIVAASGTSFLATRWLRTFALSRALIDVPNARSSHDVPTPRGGGMAIVVVVLVGLPLLAWQGVLQPEVLWALLGAGMSVAAVGWLDDQRRVPPRWRLLVHFGAATWALAWLGGLPPLPIFGTTVDLAWLGHAAGLLYLAWLLNLFNFMDGIDGIAGVETLTVCLGGVVLYFVSPGSGDAWATPVLLAAAVVGFLFWNFPHARIFMGDAGSGFVGMVLGLLSLQAAGHAPELFWGWIVLLGTFVADATVTLMRRLVRGERVHEAHRSHGYQRVARRLGSHVPVTVAFGAVNVIWLLPIACLIALRRLDGTVGVLLAYAPLVLSAWVLGAGRPEGAHQRHQMGQPDPGES